MEIDRAEIAEYVKEKNEVNPPEKTKKKERKRASAKF
jgi:hypothetical protein